MSWLAVAKKDFRDAIRSRALWALSALFVILVGAVAVAYTQVDALSGGTPTPEGLIFFVTSTVGTYVSLAALLACFKAISGERAAGTVKVLLSLPHSRRDVIVGKLVGRSAVLALPVVGTFVGGVALGSALMGSFAPVETALLAVMALLFTVAYASLFVGISASSASETRVTLLAVGFFVVVEMFWEGVAFVLLFVASGLQFPTGSPPGWYFLLQQVPPSTAFETSLELFVPAATPAALGGAPTASASAVDAFYATPALGVLVLLVWAVVPITVGYRRFERADL